MAILSNSIFLLASSFVISTSSFTSVAHFPKSFSFIHQPLASNRAQPLNMVKTGGLEVREEGATPKAGDMTLYIKAGPDGTSPGDCPFAHYVRMVLGEKNLEYTITPATQETKPDWLIDHYGGSMPALRHRKECYVESDVIAQYLDFFFIEPKLSPYNKKQMAETSQSIEGLFPAIAKYLKHTSNGDEGDLELKTGLEAALSKVEAQLSRDGKTGDFLAGDGEQITLLDCSLAPKLYHMVIGLKAFKDGAIDVKNQFPLLHKYIEGVCSRKSFQESIYPEETVIWGWSNARGE